MRGFGLNLLLTFTGNWCKLVSMTQPRLSMFKSKFCVSLCFLMMGIWPAFNANSAELRVAVASNFYATLLTLETEFHRQTGHELRISSASSGQLFAQIKHGAPFDVFMSADMARPLQLVRDGLASEPDIYARGQLVLLANSEDGSCERVFDSDHRQFVALANPDLAPFGAAAKAYLQHQGIWDNQQYKKVMGENVTQVMQMVVSKNAAMGLVAKSQLVNYSLAEHQCKLDIAVEHYPPIDQGMVFINASDRKALYTAWAAFLRSSQVQNTIRQHGYLLPEKSP